MGTVWNKMHESMETSSALCDAMLSFRLFAVPKSDLSRPHYLYDYTVAVGIK